MDEIAKYKVSIFMSGVDYMASEKQSCEGVELPIDWLHFLFMRLPFHWMSIDGNN